MSFDRWELAYAAGVVDGEGCISAYSLRGCRHVAVQVTVANTDPRMLNWLQRRWPGYIHCRPVSAGARNANKALWTWALQAKKAERFLIDIRDFLVIKQEQADLALEIRRLTSSAWSGQSRNGRQEVPEEVAARRLELVAQLKAEKHVVGP